MNASTILSPDAAPRPTRKARPHGTDRQGHRRPARRIDIRTGATLSVNFGRIADDRVPIAQPTGLLTLKTDPVDLASLRKQLDHK